MADLKHRDMINCLVALSDLSCEGEFHVPFTPICDRTELPRRIVRRHVRALARKGFAKFSKGLMNDEGQVAGAGYSITITGMIEADQHRPEAS